MTATGTAGDARLSAMLHPDLLAARGTLAERFRSADPFPHLVIENFFDPALCDRLLAEFPAFEKGCSINEDGQPGGKATFENVRDLGEVFRQIDDLIRSPEFLGMVSEVTGIPDLLYDPDYFGGGTHENRTTQDLDTHIDFNYHPTRGWHRRLNLIVYLNDEWRDEWGGSIQLHKNPWEPETDEVIAVSPLKNRCVVFETSEKSWHGFRRITPPEGKAFLSRRSFAIYLYTEERPAEETAPRHATVYVERPLPESFAAGATVTAEQRAAAFGLVDRRVQHLNRLFNREQRFVGEVRDQLSRILDRSGNQLADADAEAMRWVIGRQDELLKALYDRELQFSAMLEKLRGMSNGLLRLPLAGPIRQVGEVSGYWEDRWAGTSLDFRVRVGDEPVRTLRLVGRTHDRLDGEQEFGIVVGGRTTTYRARGPIDCEVPVELPAGADIDVRIRSKRSYNPCTAGVSTDSRELAFLLEQIVAA